MINYPIQNILHPNKLTQNLTVSTIKKKKHLNDKTAIANRSWNMQTNNQIKVHKENPTQKLIY